MGEGREQPLWRSKEAEARSAARLAAVQALYQMDLAHTDLNDVIAQFVAHRFASQPGEAGAADGGEGATGPEDARLANVNARYFAELLRGVVGRQREIDPLIDAQLAEGWRLHRIDSILRAILRAGVWELLARPDIPARVTISEYVDVAHAFFEVDEPRVTNGVLDRIGRRLRPAEMSEARRTSGGDRDHG